MKLFRLIVLVLLLVSSLPLEAFCQQGEEANCPQGYCILICNTTCLHAVLGNNQFAVFSSPSPASNISYSRFSYEDPSLDIFERPPTAIS